MATINEIKQQAAAVKNATQVGENTAERVGGALAGLAEIAEQQDSKLSGLVAKLSNHVFERYDEIKAVWAFEKKIPNDVIYARLIGKYSTSEIYGSISNVSTNNSLTHEFKKIDLSSQDHACKLYLTPLDNQGVTLEYFTESDLANYINDVDSREKKDIQDVNGKIEKLTTNHISETTQVGAKWAFENKIPNILMFARLVGDYTDAQIYNKRVHTNNSLTHEFKKIDLSSFNSNCELYLAAEEEGSVTLEYFTESDLANYINDVDSREKKDIQDVNGKIEKLTTNHISETTQVGAKWAFENKIPNILMFARLVGDYTDAQIYNKRVHTNNSLTHEFKKIDLSSFNSNCELYLAAEEEGSVTLEYFTESDLANYINDVDRRGKKDIQDVNGKMNNSIDYNHGNYNLMKHITVKKNGSGDFTNIQDAINSVKDASQTNQYDIQIYDDFIVNDLTQLYLKDGSRNTNIIPTALCALVWTKSWVHLRGMGRTVKLSVVSPSQNMDGDAFQYIQTLFVRGNVIIANLEVTIKGGRYAIHQDESANGSNSIDANCITKYRDITAIHYGNNDYTNGNKWSSCYAQANGISDGQTMIFENCKWYSYTQEPFYTHENYNYKNSCNMKFKNCAMGTAYNTGNIDRNVYFGDLGSGKLANVTIEGCNFPAFTAYSFKVNRGTEKERVNDDIRLGGVMLHGSSNGKMLVNRRRIYSLCLQTLQNNHNVKVVGGTAYDSIYGEDYKTYNGTINAPGLAIGIRLMADMQSWWGADATNVYSLAYRLGNCKETQKTLIVEIDGEQHVIMFDKNYMTEDGSSYDIHTTPEYDFNGIINDVNATINDYGIAFASNFWYDYKYFEDEESTMYNNTNEAIMPMDMLVRNGDNWKKANSETAKYVEGFAEERINPMNFGRVCLIKNCYIPATSKSIGILLTVDNNAHLVETSDESKAIFKYVNKNVIERF